MTTSTETTLVVITDKAAEKAKALMDFIRRKRCDSQPQKSKSEGKGDQTS